MQPKTNIGVMKPMNSLYIRQQKNVDVTCDIVLTNLAVEIES